MIRKTTGGHSRGAAILARFVALLLAALLSHGCVSNGYRAAGKTTPAPPLLNVGFDPGRLDESNLITVITYNGPGSWKRDAFWDEYVVTLHNPGSEPITITTAALTDSAGAIRTTGVTPWALEKESRSLEEKYREAGMAFARYTTPGLLIVGTGAAAVAGAGIFTSAAATAAAATIVVLPLYYIGVLTINHSNKAAMEREFSQRRLVMPLTLAPGESRTGSFFFPMVPSPQSLSLHWSDRSTGGDAALRLDFLRDLHVNRHSP